MEKAEKGAAENGETGNNRVEFTDPTDDFKVFDRIYLFLCLSVVTLVVNVYGALLAIWRFFRRLLFQKPVSLRGKVCFVTGSGRGLGREICLALAKKGAILACADVNEVTNSETLRLLKEMGAIVKSYKLNVANKQEVEQAARQVEEELGPVYLVVNNAAIVLPPKETTEEYVRASFNVNTLGYYWVMQAFLPYLEKRNEGHIFNICSIGALAPDIDLDIYCSTKAAVRSLTQSLAMWLIDHKSNIKVSIVHPYVINTAKEYQESLEFKAGLKQIPMSHVVDTVMDLVKYPQFEVTVPTYLKPGVILGQYFPIECMLLPRKILIKSTKKAESEVYESLPAGNLVRLCSKPVYAKE